jgi:hypothetical protein
VLISSGLKRVMNLEKEDLLLFQSGNNIGNLQQSNLYYRSLFIFRTYCSNIPGIFISLFIILIFINKGMKMPSLTVDSSGKDIPSAMISIPHFLSILNSTRSKYKYFSVRDIYLRIK